MMMVYNNYSNESQLYLNDDDDDYSPSPKKIHRREVFLLGLGTGRPSRSSCGCISQHYEDVLRVDDDIVVVDYDDDVGDCDTLP